VLRVGLTGGIASGKSHVAARLARAGFRTLDLDRVGHQVMAPGGAAYDDVVSAFGPSILDEEGAIDRKALGRVVFADPDARARLNAIVHPRIRAEEVRLAAATRNAPATVLVIEAALLVETGQHLRFDRLVVAHCGTAEQRRRLVRRDGLDAKSVAARLGAQLPAEDKRHFAHLVVDTSGSVAATDRSADEVAGLLASLADLDLRRPVDRTLAAALAFGRPRLGAAGLTSEALLEEMAAGLDLESLARRLVPPESRPWYAPKGDSEPGPEAWAGPAALYGLLRRGADPEYVAGVAYSIARVTHVSAAAHSRAVLFALACHAEVVGGVEPAEHLARRLAERFTGHAAAPQACRAATAYAAALAKSVPVLSTSERELLERLLRTAA
jgi:dephospho-CoA kinase